MMVDVALACIALYSIIPGMRKLFSIAVLYWHRKQVDITISKKPGAANIIPCIIIIYSV